MAWLPGFSIHGILQARILEWVAVPFSRGSSPPRVWTQVSCIAGGCFTIWAIIQIGKLIHEDIPRLPFGTWAQRNVEFKQSIICARKGSNLKELLDYMIKESVPSIPRVKGVCSKCSKSLFLVTPWGKDIVPTCVSFRLRQYLCPRVWLGSHEMEQSHEKELRGSRSIVGPFCLTWYFPGILWLSFYQATLPNLDSEAQSNLRFSLW